MIALNEGGNRPNGLAAWLAREIKDFCAASPENRLKMGTGERAWEEPLVGFSNGADPLYPRIKEDIGPFYLTPPEIFRLAFPQGQAAPEDLTVVCWILPQTKATKADNRQENTYPAERWVRSRHFGEIFNALLRRHLVATLQSAGFAAVAPVDAPFWSQEVSPRYGLASRWSERHAAHISGLGTFGLCDGLITPRGKAMRCGSVVARIALPPTARAYTDHLEYCLHFSQGTCGKCIKRCPSGALTDSGHDKIRCEKNIREVTAAYSKERFGIETYACGLCQTGVPCESRIPVKEKT
jgi:epoxyqueuosine reductase QueG